MLILQRPWTEQPQVAVEVEHRYSRGMVSLLHGGSRGDLATSSLLVPDNGAISIRPGTRGLTHNFPGTYAEFSANSVAISGAMSALVVAESPNASSTGVVLGNRAGSNNSLWFSESSKFRWRDSAPALFDGPVTPVSNAVYAVGISINGSALIFATNGVAVTHTISAPSFTNQLVFGGRTGAGDWPFTGRIYLAAVWNRALPWSDIVSLSANPWQLFAPSNTYIPLEAASSGLPTLSAATYVPGSLTASGFRPRVTATY